LNHEHPIVIVSSPDREYESAVRLGRIGFDNVAGYLNDGMHTLTSRPDLVAITERLSPSLAAELLSSDDPPLLLDVRTPRERAQKLIEGSVSIPLNHLSERAHELPKDRTVLVHCAGGYRSSIAASLLEKKGFPCVQELSGGITAWEAARLAVRAAHA